MKKQVQKMSFLLINLSVQQHRIRKRSSPNKNKLEKVQQLSEYRHIHRIRREINVLQQNCGYYKVTYIAGSHMVAKYSSYTQTRDEGNSRLKWKKKIEEVTLEFLIIDEHY